MSRRTIPSLADQIKQLEEQGSDLRFQVTRAGELLKLLAETMEQRHRDSGDPAYGPWTNAESGRRRPRHLTLASASPLSGAPMTQRKQRAPAAAPAFDWAHLQREAEEWAETLEAGAVELMRWLAARANAELSGEAQP